MVLIESHTVLEEFYCKDSDVEYGRSLKGGNAAGMFDNYGKTKNIQVLKHSSSFIHSFIYSFINECLPRIAS